MKYPNITPGAWTYVTGSKHISIEKTEPTDEDDRDTSIAGIWDSPESHTYQESLANAKLISLAPEMMHALDRLLNTAHDAIRACGNDPSKDETVILADRLLQQLEAKS